MILRFSDQPGLHVDVIMLTNFSISTLMHSCTCSEEGKEQATSMQIEKLKGSKPFFETCGNISSNLKSSQSDSILSQYQRSLNTKRRKKCTNLTKSYIIRRGDGKPQLDQLCQENPSSIPTEVIHWQHFFSLSCSPFWTCLSHHHHLRCSELHNFWNFDEGLVISGALIGFHKT